MQLLSESGEFVEGWLSYSVRLLTEMSVVDSRGEAPAELGLEMMAQACGMLTAHATMDGRNAPRIGVIGAVRGYRYSVEPFKVGEAITVRVRADLVEDSIVVCDGEVYRGDAEGVSQRARITLIITDERGVV